MKAIERTVTGTLEQVEERVRKALAGNGFGVLTEIYVSEVLKEKIQVDRQPLKILGACNPHFANRALDLDPEVALMLPCNVVLSQTDSATTKVSVVNPREMMDTGKLGSLAQEAEDSLRKAVEEI